MPSAGHGARLYSGFMVDPVTVGAVAKAVQSAADEGGKSAGGLVARVFGPAADELGQALARFTAFRVGNVKRIADAADRKSLTNGRDGSINPRLVRSLLDEGSYCDDELMAEYFGGLLAAGRSPSGRDDRAVSWSALVNSMSTLQLRAHFIFYREWSYALHGRPDINIGIDRNPATMYLDANEIFGNLAGLDPDGPTPNAVGLHVLAGLSRLSLITNSWQVGRTSELLATRESGSVPAADLPFEYAVQLRPSHAGIELYGWACGMPELDPQQLVSSPEIITFDVEIPRPNAVLPHLKPT